MITHVITDVHNLEGEREGAHRVLHAVLVDFVQVAGDAVLRGRGDATVKSARQTCCALTSNVSV